MVDDFALSVLNAAVSQNELLKIGFMCEFAWSDTGGRSMRARGGLDFPNCLDALLRYLSGCCWLLPLPAGGAR